MGACDKAHVVPHNPSAAHLMEWGPRNACVVDDVYGGSVAMTEHAVVIAGGGPTGLMLAAELALADVDVAVVERRPSQDLPGSRAGGLHSRTIEVLDQRGIADRFLSEGQVAQVAGFAFNRLDISDFPTRHNYGLGLWQNHIERILAGIALAVPFSLATPAVIRRAVAPHRGQGPRSGSGFRPLSPSTRPQLAQKTSLPIWQG
jgi:choline dehydrogenase-like flavoprotein